MLGVAVTCESIERIDVSAAARRAWVAAGDDACRDPNRTHHLRIAHDPRTLGRAVWWGQQIDEPTPLVGRHGRTGRFEAAHRFAVNRAGCLERTLHQTVVLVLIIIRGTSPDRRIKIGRASCRERVCPYGLNSVVAVSLKKKKKKKKK